MNIRVIIGCCPKPFVEQFNIVQQNAIKSWKHMKHPHVENIRIIMMGDEINVKESAHAINCEHLDTLKYNKYGTPLVNHIFQHIKTIAIEEQHRYPDKHVVCCYINCDIILFDEFLENISAFISSNLQNIENDDVPWLLVGKRWDTNEIKQIAFDDDNKWEHNLRQHAIQHGSDHGCGGIDYFVFSPTTYDYIYPFALGKFTWDLWLVGNVFRRDSITVDISNTNLAIHQNAPWYQASRGDKITHDRKSLFETDEVELNQLFDFYGKDIYSGTRYESIFDTDTTKHNIKFVLKHTIPRIHE